MGVGKSRVSQIEAGKVATREVLDRYVEALGGRLSLMADFGDELLRVGWQVQPWGHRNPKNWRLRWVCLRPRSNLSRD